MTASAGEGATDDPSTARSHLYGSARRVLLVGLLVNCGLGIVKGLGGWIGNSFALMADAINSFGDVLVSLVSLAALRLAQRPANERHPYGFARAEAAAATNVALIVLVSGLWLGVESIRRLGLLHEPPPLWAVWIAAGNVVVKEAVFRVKVRVGRRIGSSLVMAAAWDHRADALSSLAVLAGLVVLRTFGDRAAFADEVAALVVVCFILYAAGSLFRRSFLELLDEQAGEASRREIRSTAGRTPGVEAIETLLVRKVGLEQLVDIHVEVEPGLTVEEAHAIGHRLKDRVLAAHPTVRDVLVHLEPHERRR